MKFKIEVENGKGIWSDVYDDGKMVVFDSEDAARAALAERYPVLVQMEKYAGGNARGSSASSRTKTIGRSGPRPTDPACCRAGTCWE